MSEDFKTFSNLIPLPNLSLMNKCFIVAVVICIVVVILLLILLFVCLFFLKQNIHHLLKTEYYNQLEIKLSGTHPVHSSLHLHNIPGDYMCSCKILRYLCRSYWHRTCVYPRCTHLRLENEQAVKSKKNKTKKRKNVIIILKNRCFSHSTYNASSA